MISAGLNRAIQRGWLELHESGTFVKFTQAGAVEAHRLIFSPKLPLVRHRQNRQWLRRCQRADPQSAEDFE